MTGIMKVGAKGQVVIPQEIRRATGIEPGDRVMIEVDGKEIIVRRLLDIDSLQGCLGPAVGMQDVEAARREEIEREERGA
jgi:AbrB family looped-hinge helix DNA binding protein